MPYKMSGRTVMVKRGGKWRKKAKARSTSSGKRMIRLLRGVEHGWKPTKRRRKKATSRRRRKKR